MPWLCRQKGLFLGQAVFLSRTSAKIPAQGLFKPSSVYGGEWEEAQLHSPHEVLQMLVPEPFSRLLPLPTTEHRGTWRLHPINHLVTQDLLQMRLLWGQWMGCLGREPE